MEKVGTRPYVVVYFNADADLAIIPEPSFFLDAHSALAPSHRRQLKVCPEFYPLPSFPPMHDCICTPAGTLP